MGDVEEIVRPLEALAQRCEEATKPDRDLDGAIDRLLNNRPTNGDYDAAERAIWKVDNGWSGLLVRSSDGFARDSFCARTFTASIDAAVTLIPDGCDWCLGVGTDEPANAAISPAMKVTEWHADAATPALALCAAALKARDHLLSNPSKEGE